MLFQSQTLRLDCQERVGTLWLQPDRFSLELFTDLQQALQAVRRSRLVDVLLLRSSSGEGFPRRPTVAAYESLQSPSDRREFSRVGQEALRQLVALAEEVPTVALLDGPCLDSGLELALACEFRLAVARSETRLGQTWMDAGLLPCWGFGPLLARHLGATKAIAWIRHPQSLTARVAESWGLVDHVFSPRCAKTEIWWFLADLLERGPRARRSRFRLLGRLPTWWAASSRFSISPTAASVPLTDLVINTIRQSGRDGETAGWLAERTQFVEYGLHPSTADRRLLARRWEDDASLWNNANLPRRVGVVQIDPLTAPLASGALSLGLELVVGQGNPEEIRKLLARGVDQGDYHWLDAERLLRNIQISPSALASCDMVFLSGPLIEQKLQLDEFDRRLPESTILIATRPLLVESSSQSPYRFPQRILWFERIRTHDSLKVIRLGHAPQTSPAVVQRVAAMLDRVGFWPLLDLPSRVSPPPVDYANVAAA
jgi:3-hydroxyacyl-CoA dehydrogenase/enoyl-CoA hydratase/3-hydroxybutyryl-CoA epimerase